MHHSLTHSLTLSLTHPLTHSPTHSLTHPLTHPLMQTSNTQSTLGMLSYLCYFIRLHHNSKTSAPCDSAILSVVHSLHSNTIHYQPKHHCCTSERNNASHFEGSVYNGTSFSLPLLSHLLPSPPLTFSPHPPSPPLSSPPLPSPLTY